MESNKINDMNLKLLFTEINSNSIQYVLLRGYIPINELENSEDIDIYVDVKDKVRLKKVLLKLKWKKDKFNTGRYPHEFYHHIDMDNEHKYILDVVYGIYYGKRLYKFFREKEIFNNRRSVDIVKVPHPIDALILFILHIIFDKEKLSEKNRKRLNYMWPEYLNFYNKDSSFKDIFQDKFILIMNKVIEFKNLEGLDDYILEIQKEVLCNFEVLENKKISYILISSRMIAIKILFKIYQLFRKIRNIIVNSLNSKAICILGIDGSGKTSVVATLKEVLGGKYETQYMGSKNYLTKAAQKIFDHEIARNKTNIKLKFTKLIIILLEMWYRVIIHWPNNKIIIYDRYTWDIYIRLDGTIKVIGKVLFNLLFPKPKYVYYLYCSTETSLYRKEDIVNEGDFRILKNRFDNEYLNKKHIIAIDTEKNDIETTINIILQDIGAKSMLE